MSIILKLTTVLLLCFIASSGRCGIVVYVDASAPAIGQTGKSWSKAFSTINQALVALDTAGGQVWIKAGVYRERLTLPVGASLYGGFLGYETARTQRQVGISATILDAGKGGSAIVVPAAQFAVIDGLTIRNGLADNGGGICCWNSSTVGIHNCRIEHCKARVDGGGIYFANGADDGNSGDRTITNCVITNNYAPDGGGAYFDQHAYPTLSNCVITGNHANRGGGIYFYFHAGSDLTNCTVAYNIADSVAGAVYSAYGGPHFITYCIFAFNSAPVSGGFWGDNDGNSGNFTSTEVSNCDLFSNSGGDWGGNIYGPGTANIFVDPMFLMPDDGIYNLKVASPCVGMGACPQISPYALDSIGAAKLLADGCSVTLQGKIVSCVDSAAVYLQEPSRFTAIAVKGMGTFSRGDIVSSVTGTLSTDSNGCRVLSASSSKLLVSGKWNLAPLGTRISSLEDLTGVCTRAWGRVQTPTSIGFTLFDGESSIPVRYSGGGLSAGSYVTVTGVRTNDGSFIANTVTGI